MAKPGLREFFKRRKTLTIIIAFILVIILFFTGLFLSSGIPKVKEVTNYDSYTNNYINYYDKPLVSAHRAGAEIAPENTLMAFETCLNAPDYRVDILEFDLHVTADNVLILQHDPTLDRTSNSREYFGKKKVKVSEKTYSQLHNLNMAEYFQDKDGNYPYKGLRGKAIPDNLRVISLREVLEYTRSFEDYDLKYIIEIKNKGKLGEKAMDLLYEEITHFDIADKVIVGTFNRNVSQYIDKKYPSLTRSAGIWEVVDFYFSCIFNVDLSKKKYNFTVLQVPYMKVGINLGKKSIIDYAHYYGIAIQFWTVNKEKDMEHLISIGADAIITDCPDVAYAVVSKYTS